MQDKKCKLHFAGRQQETGIRTDPNGREAKLING